MGSIIHEAVNHYPDTEHTFQHATRYIKGREKDKKCVSQCYRHLALMLTKATHFAPDLSLLS